MRIALLTLLLAAGPAAAADAVFQYAVPVKPAKGQPSTAFLWLPPEAKQIRGVVVAGMTLAEREMVKDARVRKACAGEQLALVFLKTGIGSVDVQLVLDDLAKASGYRELSVSPLFFFGHSAGGPQAKAAAVKFADRCFGVVQYRGGHPGEPDPVPPGVPALMMLGQFDEFGKQMMRDADGRENWEYGRDSLAAFRAAGDKNLGNFVVEPGAGHFAWSDRSAGYFALFLRKAAKARIPDWPLDATEPVKCKAIDPATGWLTDLTIKSLGQKPAPHKDDAGDRSKAAWHFDRELAEATAAYHAGVSGKKDQFIRWKDPVTVDAGARFFFTEVKWVDDGQTFEVHPEYADVYPKTQPNGQGPRWPLAGKPVGHSKASILVRPVGGPVVAVGPDKFRMKYDALAPATDPGRATFLASSEGDADYRSTEQVGMLPKGFAGLKDGKDQTITFPSVGNLKPGGSVELKATSDAGLPVGYYVAVGPAVIDGGTLRVAELPIRAVFPVEVKVVAYQFGRGVEPRVKTAAPVEQTIRIEKP
jgi:hypothetical protein